MQVRFTRSSPKTHIFEYIRADGTLEKTELETKSLLLHDFTHLALETEAKLQNGFFGLISQGYTLDQLSSIDQDNPITEETLDVERIVGPLSAFVESEDSVDSFMLLLSSIFSSLEKHLPQWVTPEVVTRTRDHYLRIKGEWNSLSFNETLEVTFNTKN